MNGIILFLASLLLSSAVLNTHHFVLDDLSSEVNQSVATYPSYYENLTNGEYLPRPPEPQSVETKVHVATYGPCFGWGTPMGRAFHNGVDGTWELGLDYHALLGTYNSADPRIADWHIKWALEHGINTFIVTIGGRPFDIHISNFETGFMRSKFFEKVDFAIIISWEYLFPNYMPSGNRSELYESVEETITYLAKYYFTMPNYLRLNGKPAVFLYKLWVHQLFSGVEETKALVHQVHEVAKNNGYEIFLVGDMMYPVHIYNMEPALEGLDGITAYIEPEAGEGWRQDAEGDFYLVYSYDKFVGGSLREMQYWSNLAKQEGIAFIPPLNMGFSNRLMYEEGIDDSLFELTNPATEKFRELCVHAKEYIDENIDMVVIKAWNEYQEGSILEPTEEYGFAYLDVLRECFAIRPPMGWPPNLIPSEGSIYAELENNTLVQPPLDQVIATYIGILEEKYQQVSLYDVSIAEINDSISMVKQKVERGQLDEALLLVKSVDEELDRIIRPKILFDEAHAEYESISLSTASIHSLEEFAGLLVGARYVVDIHKHSEITFDILRGYDSLVIACPLSPFSESEINSIREFVGRGGGLLMVADAGINNAINSLAESFEVAFLLGRVMPPNLLTSNIVEHPITRRHSDLYINWGAGSCTLDMSEKWEVLVWTPNGTTYFNTIIRSVEDGPVPILAIRTYGNGRIVAISDTQNFHRQRFCGGRSMSMDILNWIVQPGGPYTLILGDLNGDRSVNIIDIATVAKAFGSKSGDENWNPEADLDNSGEINILDVSLVAKEYGKTV